MRKHDVMGSNKRCGDMGAHWRASERCGDVLQVFLVPFGDNKPAALRRARFTPEGVLTVRTGAPLKPPFYLWGERRRGALARGR